MSLSSTSPAPRTLPTGRPIILENAGVRAEVGTVAAVLRSLSVNGNALTQRIPDDEAPAMCNGIVLAPWPNRVRHGKWMLDGTEQQLDISEPSRGGALHGLLQFTDYDVVAQSTSAVTLSAKVFPQHGWPFLMQISVTYELTTDGLMATHRATNLSDARAPFGTGAHSYLRVGDFPISELTVTVPAATYYAVDAHLDPTGELPVDSTPYDLRAPRLVSDVVVDTAFGQLTPASVDSTPDGFGDVAWLTAADGSRTVLSQTSEWRYVQVFTTDVFPTGGSLIDAITLEPLTAPPNALNSGEALIWLEPGESWSGSWRLRRTEAPDAL